MTMIKLKCCKLSITFYTKNQNFINCPDIYNLTQIWQDCKLLLLITMSKIFPKYISNELFDYKFSQIFNKRENKFSTISGHTFCLNKRRCPIGVEE